jgi:hypothetical protein
MATLCCLLASGWQVVQGAFEVSPLWGSDLSSMTTLGPQTASFVDLNIEMG